MNGTIKPEGLLNIPWEEGIEHLPNESISLCVTSPPYNLSGFNRQGKDRNYDVYDDNKTTNEYQSWIKNMMKKVYRVLKNDGNFYLNLKPRYKKRVCLWPWWAVEAANELGFKLRDIVMWEFEVGADVGKSYWMRRTEIFFWFAKSNDNVFYDEDIRIKSEWTKDKRYDARGAIPSNVWRMHRVHNFNQWRDSKHPALFPPEAIDRIVLAHTRKDDLVLDPFAGIGTVGAVCSWTGRRFVGFEISKKYVDFGNEHLIGSRRPIWANWEWLNDDDKWEDVEDGY